MKKLSVSLKFYISLLSIISTFFLSVNTICAMKQEQDPVFFEPKTPTNNFENNPFTTPKKKRKPTKPVDITPQKKAFEKNYLLQKKTYKDLLEIFVCNVIKSDEQNNPIFTLINFLFKIENEKIDIKAGQLIKFLYGLCANFKGKTLSDITKFLENNIFTKKENAVQALEAFYNQKENEQKENEKKTKFLGTKLNWTQTLAQNFLNIAAMQLDENHYKNLSSHLFAYFLSFLIESYKKTGHTVPNKPPFDPNNYTFYPQLNEVMSDDTLAITISSCGFEKLIHFGQNSIENMPTLVKHFINSIKQYEALFSKREKFEDCQKAIIGAQRVLRKLKELINLAIQNSNNSNANEVETALEDTYDAIQNHMPREAGLFCSQPYVELLQLAKSIKTALQLPEDDIDKLIQIKDRHLRRIMFEKNDDEKSPSLKGGHFHFPTPFKIFKDNNCISFPNLPEVAATSCQELLCNQCNGIKLIDWLIDDCESKKFYQRKCSTMFPSCYQKGLWDYLLKIYTSIQKLEKNSNITVFKPLNPTQNKNSYIIKHPASLGCCEKECKKHDSSTPIYLNVIISNHNGKDPIINTIYPLGCYVFDQNNIPNNFKKNITQHSMQPKPPKHTNNPKPTYSVKTITSQDIIEECIKALWRTSLEEKSNYYIKHGSKLLTEHFFKNVFMPALQTSVNTEISTAPKKKKKKKGKGKSTDSGVQSIYKIATESPESIKSVLKNDIEAKLRKILFYDLFEKTAQKVGVRKFDLSKPLVTEVKKAANKLVCKKIEQLQLKTEHFNLDDFIKNYICLWQSPTEFSSYLKSIRQKINLSNSDKQTAGSNNYCTDLKMHKIVFKDEQGKSCMFIKVFNGIYVKVLV